jgi:hypothetical protein
MKQKIDAKIEAKKLKLDKVEKEKKIEKKEKPEAPIAPDEPAKPTDDVKTDLAKNWKLINHYDYTVAKTPDSTTKLFRNLVSLIK